MLHLVIILLTSKEYLGGPYVGYVGAAIEDASYSSLKLRFKTTELMHSGDQHPAITRLYKLVIIKIGESQRCSSLRVHIYISILE